MRSGTLLRWSGMALVAWAVLLFVKDFTFGFTHGSSEADTGGLLLGLDWYPITVLSAPMPLLGIVGLAGVWALVAAGVGRMGKTGFGVAVICLALWAVANLLQYWIGSARADFYSPVVLAGWILSLFALMVLPVGLVLMGFDIRRTESLRRSRSLVLLIGLLALPTFLLRGWVVGNSGDTLPWRLFYVGLALPWELCWARLGLLLVAAGRREG